MKKCSKCKQEKNFSGFYKDRKAKDGYNSICKICRLEMDRNRRKNDLVWVEKRHLQNKIFHEENRETIAIRKKNWRATEIGRESHRLSSRKWKAKNGAKVRAHSAVERAIKKGTLQSKKFCEVCNSTKRIEAHHADYRKKLEVLWLCKLCHAKITRR
jgi:hypothetical protein